MQITSASFAAPGRPNEDYTATGPTWAVALDGATHRPGVNSGCVHDVPWLVGRLGGHLAWTLATELKPDLVDALAAAINAARHAHGPNCDLDNPDSPSSTVTILRQQPDGDLDYLVLGDSPILVESPGGDVRVIADDRSSLLPSYTADSVRRHRNQPDGFWVASTNPDAAGQAVTGTIPASDAARVALLTDGVTRYVERLGLGTWADLLADLTRDGAADVVERIRACERAQLPEVSLEAHTGRRLKRHDDASAVLVVPDPVPPTDVPFAARVGLSKSRVAQIAAKGGSPSRPVDASG